MLIIKGGEDCFVCRQRHGETRPSPTRAVSHSWPFFFFDCRFCHELSYYFRRIPPIALRSFSLCQQVYMHAIFLFSLEMFYLVPTKRDGFFPLGGKKRRGLFTKLSRRTIYRSAMISAGVLAGIRRRSGNITFVHRSNC